MTYIRHAVAPPLDAYIRYLYYLDGGMPYPCERILPLPALDLKINLGGPLQLHEGGRSTALTESWWVGLWSISHIVEWPADLRLFGVNFKPGGAYPFLLSPLSDLHNRVVSLDTIWGRYANEIRERLLAVPTVLAGFHLLERLLLARLREVPYGLDIVAHAINEITHHHGILSIRALSDQIGISQNHLGTQFKRMVGVTSKELARLYRFDHVLRSIDPTQPVDWMRITQQTHYYDQSHFNKDFVAFTGHNPTAYLKLRRRIQAENPNHNRLRRNLPID